MTVHPLSFAQERLWFLHQLNPGDCAYNEAFVWRLSGSLKTDALGRAIQALVTRHEVLRTVFETQDGHPRQVILPQLDVPLEVRDLSAIPGPMAELEPLVQAEVAHTFDLTRGPLLRTVLCRFAGNEHALLLVCHHIVIDSWSLGALCQELGALCDSFAQGGPDPLPPSSIQYSQFARWQRQRMSGPRLEEQLAYWRGELQGDIPMLSLPTDRPRSAQPGSKGARVESALSSELTSALKRLARKEGGTLFVATLAGFQLLLHRYTGLLDFAVGTVIANRVRPEFETMLGFFANALVMRADFSGNPTVVQVLHRARDRAFGAYDHQEVPFETVVADLRPTRHAGRNPYFEVAVVLESAPAETLQFSGVSAHREFVGPGTAKFDLTLILQESAGALHLTWEYRTDLFDAGTIQRMSGHFERLLTEMVADPTQPASTLPMLTDAERHQLLFEWNDTRRDFPRHHTIHQLFEQQASRTPDAVALLDDTYVLTYRELNERANQVAHYLCECGVAPRDRVAVVLDRSVDYIVAVLAILKAGAAYVPIDPASPELRLRTILSDAGIKVVLDRNALASSLTDRPRTNLDVAVGPDDPCYVIYTSGSTGTPKGVEVRHRGVVRLVFGNDFLPFDDKQTYLLLSPVQFDVSTLEIWGALLHGSRLAVDSQREFELPRLRDLLARHHVTCLWLTSALFNVVIDHQPQILSRVPHVVIGGEALSVSHVRRALDVLPQTQIINGYGPTETTTFATTFAIPRSLAADASSVPIGRPIGNTTIYLLDTAQQLVPIGVNGEICIGGVGVATGYVGDAELTSARFIPNPFEAGTTLYRTGDIGRYKPDGTLDYLGRTDHQVKVRGFRVELGEVEHHLRQHPHVREAVVIASDTGSGDLSLRLVAYFTTKADAQVTPTQLQSFLEERLPGHAVPSLIVALEALPLTPTGKVDRRALPSPDHVRKAERPEVTSRLTPTQERLAAIWRQVLGVTAVGLHDDFFDLGGDSLMATRVQARIEDELGTRLSLSTLFQQSTMAALAKAIDAHQHTAIPESSSSPLFWLHFPMGAQRLQKHLGSARRVHAVHTELDDELLAWHRSGELAITMEGLAARCCAAIERVQSSGPYTLAGSCFGGVLAFEVARQFTERGQEVELLVLVDAVYSPGCTPASMPAVRRGWHHVRRAVADGPGYISAKVGHWLTVARRRRSQLGRLERGDLPWAGFLSALQTPYRAEPFQGSTLLFRAVAGSSFALDLGTTHGWREIVRGPLHIEDLRCTHGEISDEEQLAHVANRLRGYWAGQR